MSTTKRFITAEDLYAFERVFDPQISPEGDYVVFCVQQVERKTEKKYTNLWLASIAGGESCQLTYGKQVDTQPRWSPNGQHLAFISNREDEKQSQIYLLPLSGGEARPLTNFKGDIGALVWSPDGQKIACQLRLKDAEVVEREADEDKKKLGVVCRHITRTFYKRDGEGYLPQERQHLWLIDVATGTTTQLTNHSLYDEGEPCWSPDGQHLLFISNHHQPEPDLDPAADDLFLLPVTSGSPRRLETPYGSKSTCSFSPDGKWIAYLAHVGPHDWWQNTCLWLLPVDGSAPAQNLTEEFDFNINVDTVTDFGERSSVHLVWSPDSQIIYFNVSRHGKTVLQAINLADNLLQRVVAQKGVVTTFNLSQDGRKIAYLYGDMTTLNQVWVGDLASKKHKPLTHFNQIVFDELQLGEVEMVWITGGADNQIQGWVMRPPDFEPTKTYPTIIQIHGGPLAQYGYIFMHEFYYLAAQGYVVAFCNPRGGQGYGAEHAKGMWNAWGKADYEDVMAWTNYVAALPYVDAERMGVTGGSYGGFLTNWIIGQTNHFKAAVTQRCVSNQLSGWGSSDYNWVFQQEIGDDLPPWENFENYWERSPMKYIGRATTPTLIIHSEKDYRCHQEQGEQIYIALKRLGVDTELVLFPDESHGLSRGGRTDRRIARLQHMLRWFNRYLGVA